MSGETHAMLNTVMIVVLLLLKIIMFYVFRNWFLQQQADNRHVLDLAKRHAAITDATQTKTIHALADIENTKHEVKKTAEEIKEVLPVVKAVINPDSGMTMQIPTGLEGAG